MKLFLLCLTPKLTSFQDLYDHWSIVFLCLGLYFRNIIFKGKTFEKYVGTAVIHINKELLFTFEVLYVYHNEPVCFQAIWKNAETLFSCLQENRYIYLSVTDFERHKSKLNLFKNWRFIVFLQLYPCKLNEWEWK